MSPVLHLFHRLVPTLALASIGLASTRATAQEHFDDTGSMCLFETDETVPFGPDTDIYFLSQYVIEEDFADIDGDGLWDGYTDESAILPPSAGYSAYTDFDDLDANPPSEPPLPAPWYGQGWGRPGTGHAGPPDPYNIYVQNCHTATNQCTLTAPEGEVRGALICGAAAITTPTTHSASWGIFVQNRMSVTCIYNWGRACCWQGATNPPDVSSGDGLRCAKWACGDQYRPGTTTLPAGDMVEIPGYAACVREVTTGAVNDPVAGRDGLEDALKDPASSQASCLACCTRRANMWNGSGYDNPIFKNDFLTQCRALCTGFFGNGVTLGARHATTQCVGSATRWSFVSRAEQCRGCCLDGAQSGAYPRAEVNQCLAVCSQTFP